MKQEGETADEVCTHCKGTGGFWWNATCAHQEWVDCEYCQPKERDKTAA